MVDISVSVFTFVTTYFGYAMLIFVGYLRDFLSKFTGGADMAPPKPGYAPLVSSFEYFFTRRLYGRIRDCWDRPVSSNPGSWITVMERGPVPPKMDGSTLKVVGPGFSCLNLGSYNYLGFADNSKYAMDKVYSALDQYGPCPSSVRAEAGSTKLLDELEVLTANFLGQEAAVVFGMGFQTNSTVLPNLVGKGGLIISDSLNHSSLVVGCKTSKAKIMTFKHNDMENLEEVVRSAIANGQPRTRRPWTKILIVVEGIYSMEGEILPLPDVIRIKKKYKCYLYVDEAHSIGALGPRGRGVTDYWKVDPKEVDILMGTFTKSFGAVGGYIAASKKIIDFVKKTSYAFIYDCALPAPCAAQIIGAMEIMMGVDGTDLGQHKIEQLRKNSNYFRQRLRDEGLIILGDDDSPVIPMMLFLPAVIAAFSREMLKHRIAVVVVGFPATPLLLGRVRFCISAGHTIEELEHAVVVLMAVGENLGLKRL